MSHSYDMECANCGVKFCECHDPIYFDDEIFCSEECKTEWEEEVVEEPK